MAQGPLGDFEDILSRLPQLPRFMKAGIPGIVALLILIIWAASGIYVVGPGEQGVIRRFGGVVRKTSAGLNFHFPWPIEQRDVVNVERVRRLEVGFRSNPRRPSFIRPVPAESLMLTGDENIVDAQLIVQYRIKDPVKFLFRLQNPISTLRAATEIALRSRVGNTTVDEVLTVGRAKVQEETRKFLQELMDTYESGILITAVKLQTVDAPDQVKDAFHEVVRAREDREKLVRQAEGYREDVIPKARGRAQEIIRAAEGYKEERILRSRGDAAKFKSVLAEYRKAPRVTRERLHLETLERVLPDVDKIIVDPKGGGSVLPILPLKGLTGLQQPTSQTGQKQGGQ
ncbi:MAG: FtsH protease activity modulator HflK [Candidatus Binatia bacterium]